MPSPRRSGPCKINRASLSVNCRTLYITVRQAASTPHHSPTRTQNPQPRPSDFSVRAILVLHLAAFAGPQTTQDLIARLQDTAGTQRQHSVARFYRFEHGVHAAIHRAHIFRPAVAELPQPFRERFGGDSLDGLFGSRVDVHQKNAIGLEEGARK